MVEQGFGHVFEDEQILVVNKPAGIATQAPQQFDSLESRVRNYQRRDRKDRSVAYLGIPHRLDRCVSGVIVFAKRKKAAQRLSKQFENRLVDKTYHALVAGTLLSTQGTWTDFVRKVPHEPSAETVEEDHPDARPAVMHFVVEHQAATHARLRIQLETGRMHQIRIQCASRGFPVLGDSRYGSLTPFGPTWQNERERAIALHASCISFAHPKTREALTFNAPFPSYWSRLDLPES